MESMYLIIGLILLLAITIYLVINLIKVRKEKASLESQYKPIIELDAEIKQKEKEKYIL